MKDTSMNNTKAYRASYKNPSAQTSQIPTKTPPQTEAVQPVQPIQPSQVSESMESLGKSLGELEVGIDRLYSRLENIMLSPMSTDTVGGEISKSAIKATLAQDIDNQVYRVYQLYSMINDILNRLEN